jgi:matrix metalloproteinase-16 (membrane-inserted)
LGEKWTLWDEEDGTSLFSVALHEMGHSLGLSHSSQKNSVMYAWYQSESTELQEDDKLAINTVYGLRPEYRFVPLDPKHRIYKPQITTTPPSTTTPSIKRFTTKNKVPTTTKRYKMNIFKKLLIQNSRVYIYPKSTSSLSF